MTREHGVIEHIELVGPLAQIQPQLVVQEQLVLDAGRHHQCFLVVTGSSSRV
jgi:hypothetical protein